jgi:hypothetical protein
MLGFNNLIVSMGKLFNLAKRNLIGFLNMDEALCHIVEIDVARELIVLHCRTVASPIKFKFDEIITDVIMISNLRPEQAALVGYYYGMYCHNKKAGFNPATDYDFSFADSKKRYQILSQARFGNINYHDKLINEVHIKPVIQILAKRSLIMEFEPLEACYLGILGGVENNRPSRGKKTLSKFENHNLRLIK